MDADLPKNAPVFSLRNELILDRTAVQEMLSFQFTREAKLEFFVLYMLECVYNCCIHTSASCHANYEMLAVRLTTALAWY